MTIWDLLLPWRNVPALGHARKTIKALKRERDFALSLSRKVEGDMAPLKGKIAHLETELQQTKRAGLEDVADKLGVSFEDIKDGKIEVLLHDDPQAVYRALDGGKATEIKFRLVKVVNLELRLVIRNMIDTLADCTLTPKAISDMAQAEEYATPRVMETKRKVLGGRKRKTLGLNYAKGKDDEAQAQAEAETKA